jgi:hypothetical protein
VYEALLDELLATWTERGHAGPSAATLQAIAATREEVRARLKAVLPPAYEEFLARVDGLDHNGLVVYGCARFLEANLAWQKDEYTRRLLVFAESAQHLYVFDQDERRYQMLDRHRLGVLRSFAAFQALLRTALSTHRPGDHS